MSRVLVLGSYVQDHCWRSAALPAPGETRIGRFTMAPGGKGFNQAVAAHRLGVDVCFHGALGRDALAVAARACAEEIGLPCCWFETDQPSGAASIVVDAAGRNQICVALGANEALPMAAVQALQAALRPAAVVVCQLETALAPVAAALQAARAAGATTLLNPAPINERVDLALLRQADLLTPNETEFAFLCQQLLGLRVAVDAEDFDVAAVHAACRQLCPEGSVVVTRGEHGVFVSHPADRRRGDAHEHALLPAVAVEAVDTTGAGDAFSGALAAALLLLPQAAFAEQVKLACRVAGLSTERAGAAPSMPTLAEVEARFGAVSDPG